MFGADDEYLSSFDPALLDIVKAIRRQDRSALPRLHQTLARAAELFADYEAIIARAKAELSGRPQAEYEAAMSKVTAPMMVLDQLLEAVMLMPDPSFEHVLKELSKCVNNEGVRQVLAEVRAKMPRPSDTAEVKHLDPGVTSTAGPGRNLAGRSLAVMIRDRDFKGVLDAVTEATIGELLSAMAEAIRSGKRSHLQALGSACHRYPEPEVLFAVRPLIADADPSRREAAALALGREAGVAPDERVMSLLYRLLADGSPEVVAAAVAAIGQRTSRNFTPDILARLRQVCEQHPSTKVRSAYSDVFYAPYLGADPVRGALEAWCRLARDPDDWVRYYAVARAATFTFDEQALRTYTSQLLPMLDVAKTDPSARVRFAALSGLVKLGKEPVALIAQELTRVAHLVEQPDLSERPEDADDGLPLLNELIQKPNRRYVAALERILAAFQAAGIDTDSIESQLEECRNAPSGGILERIWPR